MPLSSSGVAGLYDLLESCISCMSCRITVRSPEKYGSAQQAMPETLFRISGSPLVMFNLPATKMNAIHRPSHLALLLIYHLVLRHLREISDLKVALLMICLSLGAHSIMLQMIS